MKKTPFLGFVLSFFLWNPAVVHAQGNQCRTASVGSSTGNCASEAFVTDSVGAGGNVRGPNSSTVGHVATFADTTGKLIQDGGAPAGGTVTQVNTAGVATGGPITASGTVTVTAASKSDQQSGSSAVVAVTPSQQQQHDSAAKAWLYATQSAGSYTLQASYNIASFSKTGTGAITITMTTAFASSNYSVTCAPAGIGSLITTTSITSASVFLLDIRTLAAANIDANVSCHVFGRQ